MNIIEKIRHYRYWSSRVKQAIEQATSTTGETSFSQAREDDIASIILDKVERFIDIGANDGITFSNTWRFACNGASGLAFEPVQQVFKKLKKAHRKNAGVCCINGGISDRSGHEDIYVAGYGGLLSSLARSEKVDSSEVAQTERISLKPLKDYLRIYPGFQDCDLLSIDVEGHELEVLKGIDFTTFTASVIIVETDSEDENSIELLHHLLEENLYRPAVRTPFNTLFTHSRLTISNESIANISKLGTCGIHVLL